VQLGAEAAGAVSDRRQARRKHGLATKNRSKMTAMLECAAPHIRVAPEDFNSDPLKVATLSHTLTFKGIDDPECPDPAPRRRKWIVEADPTHRRSDMITALVPVKYDPEAKCPLWIKNLERFQPNKEQRRTLQQFTGASLLGKPIQRVMFHYGTGGNFKSVFLETVTRVLGDGLAVGLPTESLIGGAEGNAGGPRPDLERVFGKRMLRILELPNGVPLKADLIKKLTGGERWPVRSLYKSFYEFTPVAKTHMSGNSYPNFAGEDGGMQRRLLVIEWPVKIAEAEQRDFDLVLAELLEEKAGILNWLIEGALDYLTNGLFVSEATRMSTRDYFDEMDPVARFIRDCVEIVDDKDATEGAREVYLAYRAHCAANARYPIYETRFGRIMKQKFKHDDKARKRVYLGIRLHDVPTAPASDREPPPHDQAPDGPQRGSDCVVW
jgi:putative DNA primase/helicase